METIRKLLRKRKGFSLAEMMIALGISSLLIYLGQHQFLEMKKHRVSSEQTLEQIHMQRIIFIKMVKRAQDIVWGYFDMDNTLKIDPETLIAEKLDFSTNNAVNKKIEENLSDLVEERGYGNKDEILFRVDSHTKEVYKRVEIPNADAATGFEIKLNLEATFISRCAPADNLLNILDESLSNEEKIAAIKALSMRPIVYKKPNNDKTYIRCCPVDQIDNCSNGEVDKAPMEWLPQLFIVEYPLKSDGVTTDFSVDKLRISQFPVLDDKRSVEGAGFVTYFNKKNDVPTIIETYYFVLGNKCLYQMRKDGSTHDKCNSVQKKTKIGLGNFINVPTN